MSTALAAYSFNGTGDVVVDHTGNGHDFSIVGKDLQRTSGHTDGGLTSEFAGTAATIAEPPFGQTPDRTVMLWAKGTGQVWYVRWQIDSINSGAWGILELAGKIGAWGRNATASVNPSASTPGDGLWHHYAATYSDAAEALSFYLDGALAASADLVEPMRTDADRIDICEFGSGTTIDDLRIYGQALTEAQIADAMATPVVPEPVVEVPPSSPERTVHVEREGRAYQVPAESRRATTPAEPQVVAVRR